MEQNKKKALGRGLEELFNIEEINYEKVDHLEETIMATASEEEIREIPLNELRVNPYQPRQIFNQEKLQELATSIKEYGVIQPIIVKKSIKGYEIVAGERRFRASQLAGKETIPAVIRNFSDEQMMQIAILENLQRENLNAIEEAEAYKSLMNNLNITQEEVAKKVGKSRSHITNMLGLLTLPTEVKQLIGDNKITMGHARVLSKLEDEDKIRVLAKQISDENISVRELEKITTENPYERKHKINKPTQSNEYKTLENELSEYLGTRVKLNHKKIEITYENENDLNRILEIIDFNNNK